MRHRNTGAGPTGLVSALTCAKAGYEVVVNPVERVGFAASEDNVDTPDLRTTAHLSPTVKAKRFGCLG